MTVGHDGRDAGGLERDTSGRSPSGEVVDIQRSVSRLNPSPGSQVWQSLAVSLTVDELVRELEDGSVHSFGDWPPSHLEVGPTGVYTIWRDTQLLYVGMSYVHRSDTANQQAKGVFGRLASHASGRRSGDQFCIYICDRFVVPTLSIEDMTLLASGVRLLDRRTRDFIREHLRYRVAVTSSGAEARALESLVRREGLPQAGRPAINP